MIARCSTFGLDGFHPFRVTVEVDVARGAPSFSVVGLADAAVQESRERVWSALRSSGYAMPLMRKTVNLSPSGTQKRGTHFDVAIAIGILAASEQCPPPDDRTAWIGEISLEGEFLPVRGVLPLVRDARRAGITEVVVAPANGREAALAEGVVVRTCGSLREAADALRGTTTLPSVEHWIPSPVRADGEDLSRIRGQAAGKRALEIAATGRHSLLLLGPPGSGKTLLARSLVGILPPSSIEDLLTATNIHSLAGLLSPEGPALTAPPFRAPHHSCSPPSLVGGGAPLRPGEISLAHGGVLFLDELPHFARTSLDALREPLEQGEVHIRRVRESATLPADPLVVAAMNPCPCGPKQRGCTCSPERVKQYRARISGPLLDRIDLVVRVQRANLSAVLQQRRTEEGSEVVAARVAEAVRFRERRFQSKPNSRLALEHLDAACALGGKARDYFLGAAERLGLSARALHRTLRVARSIADLGGIERVTETEIAEALQYRQEIG